MTVYIIIAAYIVMFIMWYSIWRSNKKSLKKIKYLEKKNISYQRKLTNAYLIGENLKKVGELQPRTKRAARQSQLINNYINTLKYD